MENNSAVWSRRKRACQRVLNSHLTKLQNSKFVITPRSFWIPSVKHFRLFRSPGQNRFQLPFLPLTNSSPEEARPVWLVTALPHFPKFSICDQSSDHLNVGGSSVCVAQVWVRRPLCLLAFFR